MAFTSTSMIMERPRLIAELSRSAPQMAVVGPIGSGATTTLRQWASQQKGTVVWATAGAFPGVAPDALMVDNAGELTDSDWAKIRELRRSAPELIVRFAAHSRCAIPPSEEMDFIFGLSFTLQETREYLASISSGLDAGTVQQVTGGLPSAVDAVGRLQTSEASQMKAALARLRADTLPAEFAELAIPETLTTGLVVQLGGARVFLDDMELLGLGSWIFDSGNRLFRVTAPVRAATLEAYGVVSHKSVRTQAGQALLASNDWYGAIVEGTASGAFTIVDRAFKGGGLGVIIQHGAMIKVLLEQIPRRELRRHPIIAMALALIFNARQQHRLRAVEMLGVALLGTSNTPIGSGERAIVRTIESVGRRLMGIRDGGVKAAGTAGRIIAALPASEQQELSGLLGDMHSHLAISLMYGGLDSAAIVEFERALALPGRPSVELLSCGGIAMIHALAGDLATAQDWIDSTLERPWPATTLNGYAGSLLNIAQAKVLLERGELDQADECLDRVWPIVGTIEHWPILAHLRAMIMLARGQSGEALERLLALRKQRGARSPHSQLRLLDLTESTLRFALGGTASSLNFRGSTGDSPSVSIGVARSALFTGQPERALRMLSDLAMSAPEVRANRAVLEAIALHRLGRQVEAETAAGRARTIAEAHGLSTPFILIPSSERELFDEEVRESAAPVKDAPIPQLSARENVVLAELRDTASTSDIASRLQVSVNTVKSQRQTLYRKLGAASREEALAIAIGHGILMAPDDTQYPPSSHL